MDHLFQDCRELELLAQYHKLRGEVRWMGWREVTFGLLLLLIAVLPLPLHLLASRGAVRPSFQQVNLALAAVGLVLLAEGAWTAARPTTPAVLMAGGVTFLALGLWCLSAVFFLPPPGRASARLAFWSSVLWLPLAFLCFVQYLWAHQLFRRKYPEEELARVGELLRHVTKTKLKDATDVITFRVRGQEWRVLLGPGAALFVDMRSKRVLAARKDEVRFEVAGPAKPTGLLPALFCVRDQTWEGALAPAAFAKYQAWKLEESAAAPAAERAAPEVPPDAFQPGQHDILG